MKQRTLPILLVVAALALSTLACSLVSDLLSGVGQTSIEMDELADEIEGAIESAVPLESLEPFDELETLEPEESSEPADDASSAEESEFPLPPGAENIMEMGSDTVNFQVKMTLDEVIAFYQETLTKQGLTEREILHVESDQTFSMVFDGTENGIALVIQGVDLGDGLVNVNLRYEDV